MTSLQHRWAGYNAALENYGLVYDDSLVYQRSTDPNYDWFLAQSTLPDAVFAASDWEALMFLKSARKFGLRIPEDSTCGL